MNKWHGGKGSSRRKNDDQKKYEENWDKIFKKDREINDLKSVTEDKPIQKKWRKNG